MKELRTLSLNELIEALLANTKEHKKLTTRNIAICFLLIDIATSWTLQEGGSLPSVLTQGCSWATNRLMNGRHLIHTLTYDERIAHSLMQALLSHT